MFGFGQKELNNAEKIFKMHYIIKYMIPLDKDLIDYIIKGLDINICLDYLNEISNDPFALLKYLHKNGANIKKKNIFKTIQFNNLDIIKYLHENGVNVNVNDGRYHIMHSKDVAASCGKLDILMYLHEINNEKEYSCLVTAVKFGRLDVVKYLIEIGYDINYNYSSCVSRIIGNYNILEIAASYGEINIVKYLCDNNINLDLLGNDAIISAVRCKHYNIAKYLILKLEHNNLSV
jgi:ankyrin repeat protein